MNERTYTVYKHTTPDGKVYIGVTCQKPEIRWNRGIGYSGKQFSDAIARFGWDNISHEIIATGLQRIEAENKEQELIELYRAREEEFGYNKHVGGGLLDEDGLENIKNATRRAKAKARGNTLKAETRKKMSDAHKRNGTVRSVVCIETDETFESVTEAGKSVGADATSVSYACKTGRVCKGFHWCYADSKEKFSPHKNTTSNAKCVVNIDTGVSYESAAEAERKTGIHRGTILAVCNKTNYSHTAGGHRWAFVGQEYEERLENRKKKVLNITTGEEFESITKASKSVGVNISCLHSALNGRSKTSGGCEWRYI